MVDFKNIEQRYSDIDDLGSRPAGLMTEFNTESGRPIYISASGEIVSEKSMTIPYNGKYVNVPSIHDGIEYSESEIVKLLDEKKIKPTSTHKTLELAVKAAKKRSPSLLSEETVNAIESKYKTEMLKRKATYDQMTGDETTELITPEAKAKKQMQDLELIEEDEFLIFDKDEKLNKYVSSLSDSDKENIKSYLEKPQPRINSIEGEEAMAKGRARRNLTDQTVSAFAEGGLLDEGGTVDPVSGNEVPAGSTQKEVRDDIPAQLSEGEFVFPADVVRYIGLENLMELRQKAKEGLQQMDDMGQMGNSEEAILDDDIEYNAEIDMLIDEWNPEDGELEMAEGGVVYAQQGAFMPQQNNYTPYQAPTAEQMIFGGGTGAPFSGVQSPVKYTSEEYVGPSGERITVTFINGQPVYPIPEGYKKYNSNKVVKEKPVVEAPKVQPEKDGRDDPSTQSTQTPTLGYSKQQAVGVLNEVNPKLEERYKGLPQGIKGVLTMGLIPSVISAVQYGVEANKAVKQVEQGYKLSSFDPTSEYGKWRSNLDNEYMAAAMLESENEARDVLSGEKDWRESNFGSREEAKAVANSGWGSDEHFKTIEDEFDEIDSKPSQQEVDNYNKAEIDRAIKEGRQANLADSDSSGPDEDSDDPTKSDSASFGGDEEWD